MKTIDDILACFGVKSFKITTSGLVAIRKGGKWLYFRFEDDEYRQTGSTIRFQPGG